MNGVFIASLGHSGSTLLDLITPPTYLNAISEGDEPTAADKATVERQVATRQIKVLGSK